MSKLTKSQRKVLEDALKAATFEKADFFNMGGPNFISTADIKEHTRVYRQTWIIARIEAVLEGREREWIRRRL